MLKKRILTLTGVLTLTAACLAGCGGRKTDTGSAGPGEAVKEEEAGEAAPVEEPAAGAQPEMEEPAAGAQPEVEEPAAGAQPEMEEPAAGTQPEMEEPAARAQPEVEEPAAGTQPEAEETEEDQETSPFLLWEHEGYVDDCKGYTWRKEFINCDYDGDGKTDRVNRVLDRDEDIAYYTVEFGNGDELRIPKVWDTGFPHIQGGDLDGDGSKEILVTFSYDTGTDPYSYGDMFLFDRDASTGEYSEIQLPLAKGENGGKGFDIEYDKPENGWIRFGIKEGGLSMEEEVEEDFISNWWTDEATSELRYVYKADIRDEAGPTVRCFVAPLPRNSLSIGFDLHYINGEYKIENMEKDSPDEDIADNRDLPSDNTEEETIPEYFVYVGAPDGYANLRTGPGTEYDIICRIPNGESLEVYRGDATAKNGKKWLKVAYYRGGDEDPDPWVSGYIAESQLQD